MVGMVMVMVMCICMTPTGFAVEYIEIQAEGIKRCYKDAGHDCKVSKTRARNMASSHRFDDGVF